MRPPSPFEHPSLRPDLPAYPVHLQLLRVTSTTITGPAGQTLYVSNTQQLRTDNLLPRDREPCLVTEPNLVDLTPGYYLGRLAGHYASLPVYEVVSATSDAIPLPGLTPEQWELISTNLSQSQIDNLNNLDACQLQILLQTLTIPQISTITSSSVPQQIQNLLITTPPATPTGFQSSTQTLVTTLTTHHLLQLTTSIQDEKLTELVTTIPVSQIQKLIDSLPTPELSRVVNSLPTPQLINLLTSTTNDQLTRTVTALTTPQLDRITQVSTPQLTSLMTNLTTNQILTLTQLLTNNQIQTLLDEFNISTIQQLLNTLTYDQFNTLVTAVPNLSQIGLFLQVITVPQLQTLILSLTQPQLQTLITNYSPPTADKLVNKLPPADLPNLLNQKPPAPVLGNQLQPPGIPVIVGQPSSVPAPLQGYAATVATQGGELYTYAGGQWNEIGGGGSSPTGTNGSAALGVTYTVTGSYGNTGLSVTLPGAGTYLLLCNIFSTIDGTQHEYSGFRLYDSTNSTAVGPLGRHELAATTAAQPHTAIVTLHHIQTVAGSTTVRLEAITTTTGTAEVLATETVMRYVKLN